MQRSVRVGAALRSDRHGVTQAHSGQPMTYAAADGGNEYHLQKQEATRDLPSGRRGKKQKK